MKWWQWLILIVGVELIFFYQLWIHYLAVMNLKRVKETTGLKPWANLLGSGVLFFGLVLDWIGNLKCTVIFLDLPSSWRELITGRFQRYQDREPNSRRGKASWEFSDDMLNDFDPDGPHIRKHQ